MPCLTGKKGVDMTNVMTTKLSSKGQVVLPEALRNIYGWGAGTSFTVVVYKGSVIMQPIKTPSDEELAKEFDEVFEETRAQARAAGMKPKDIVKAIAEVRCERRARRR